MLRIVEWFGGIGAATQAIKRLGIDYELVDYVELDKYAVKSFNLLNETSFRPKDIKDVIVNGYLGYGEVDLLIAGWPCQDLSIAGKQKGLINSDRSSLIWTTIKKIQEMWKKPRVILLENVKGLLSDRHWLVFETIIDQFRAMGYKFSYKLLNAKYFGVPQNRERVYCVLTRDETFDWDWSDKFNSVNVKLKDILDKDAEWQKAVIASSPPKVYFKNKLSQYNNKIIEVDIEKLHNQNGEEINRVGQLGTLNEEGEFKTIPFKQDKNFQGVSGISTTLVASSPQSKCKVMKYEPISFNSKRYFQGVEGVSKTLRAGDCDKEAKIIKEEEFEILYRNLTSRECWKLMGFYDKTFDKVEGNISNNQLCKQAGNSIVVNVLEAIFSELYMKD